MGTTFGPNGFVVLMLDVSSSPPEFEPLAAGAAPKSLITTLALPGSVAHARPSSQPPFAANAHKPPQSSHRLAGYDGRGSGASSARASFTCSAERA